MLHYNRLEADPNAASLKSLYVWEAPVRLWHWVMFLAMVVLGITGLLISYPPPAVNGEASEHFLFGYIRFAHFTAGYVLAVSWLLRIYWAIVGNDYARQLFIVPVWSGAWWEELGNDFKTYAYSKSAKPYRYGGHNPMAQLAMFLLLTLGSLLQIVTGFALYSEGAGKGSWADLAFGWVIPLFGQSQDVHTVHHATLWVLVVFTIVHLYMVFRQDITTRESILSAMVSGYRTFKD